jgi:superfamily II DNA or RNA helicase
MWGTWTWPEYKQTESKLPPLLDYQTEAIDFIYSNWSNKINTLCALDVGMGKTRVACEIISRLFGREAPNRLQGYALVCCSTSGVRDTIWKETLENYNQKISILEGEQFSRIKLTIKKLLTIPPFTTCLITYANLCKNDNITYFKNTPPNLIIFDEYHTLTNNSLRKDQQYRNAIMELPVRLRMGLTATPFVNNEMESVIAFGILNDTKIIETFLNGDLGQRQSLVQRVKAKNFLFYKDNPYNQTPVSEWVVSIPMGREHYNQYLKIHNNHENDKMSNTHKIGKLTVSPVLLDKKERLGLNEKIETGKVKALRAIISQLPDGDKIIIFDNYRETLKYIMRLGFVRSLRPVLYIGGAKSNNQASFERFNNNSDCRILLTTRQEGGEGLNLQAANHLVLMNCWWTVKDIIQILGRIKRKGQRKPVYIYIFGYNLFDCLEPGEPPDSYILPEDSNFYRVIRQKKEMCEEWGIAVETKLPHLKSFFNFSTFERDFTHFLEMTIKKNPPKIMSEELKLSIDASKKEYADKENDKKDFLEKEMRVGETFLQYLFFLYCQHCKEEKTKNHIRKKINVQKKKKINISSKEPDIIPFERIKHD